MKKQKKVICFDMDGTLVNSDIAIVKAFNKCFTDNKLPKKKKEEILKFSGLPVKKIINGVFPKISKRKLEKCASEYYNNFEKFYENIKPIDGAMESLKKIKKDWKLALTTGTDKLYIHPVLKHGGIDPKIFDIIVGDNEVKRHKPYPDEIKKVEKILETPVEWVVGDTIYDIKAGKSAKKRTVAVLTGKTSIEKLVKADPTILIQSVYMLPEALRA